MSLSRDELEDLLDRKQNSRWTIDGENVTIDGKYCLARDDLEDKFYLSKRTQSPVAIGDYNVSRKGLILRGETAPGTMSLSRSELDSLLAGEENTRWTFDSDAVVIDGEYRFALKDIKLGSDFAKSMDTSVAVGNLFVVSATGLTYTRGLVIAGVGIPASTDNLNLAGNFNIVGAAVPGRVTVGGHVGANTGPRGHVGADNNAEPRGYENISGMSIGNKVVFVNGKPTLERYCEKIN